MSQASDDFTHSAYWMEEHMKDAADAMQDNASAAEKSADTARQVFVFSRSQFEIDHRPYLFFGIDAISSTLPSKFAGQDVPDKAIVINTSLVNRGRTPAVNMVFSWPRIDIAPDAEERVAKVKFPSLPEPGTGDTLIVDEPRIATAVNSGIIPKAVMDDVASGKTSLVVWSLSAYSSQYSKKVYRARYCYVYHPIGLPFGPCSYPGSTGQD